MRDRITYLIGAGASAAAVPVVQEFNDSVHIFLEMINSIDLAEQRYEGVNNNIPLTKKQLKENFYEESKDILSKINSQHTSIDNYARMLFLTRQHRVLRKLKSLLQIYLLWIQFEKPYDKRYDLFISSILKFNNSYELEFPENINIISWNYDIQFEISSEKYFNTDAIRSLQNNLNTSSNPTSLRRISENQCFSIIRLNGNSCAWYEGEAPQNIDFKFLDFRVKQNEVIENLLAYYYWLAIQPSGSVAGINYAWEENKYTRQVRELASKKASTTDVLVVIGYSFPTFNRTIDRELFASMTNLKKVYIQTMKNSMSEVSHRFKSLAERKIELVPIEMYSGKEEFYIPFEFIG